RVESGSMAPGVDVRRMSGDAKPGLVGRNVAGLRRVPVGAPRTSTGLPVAARRGVAPAIEYEPAAPVTLRCITGTVGMLLKPPPVRAKSIVQRVATPVAEAGMAATRSALSPGPSRLSPGAYLKSNTPDGGGWVLPSTMALSRRPPSPPTRTNGTWRPAVVVRRRRM